MMAEDLLTVEAEAHLGMLLQELGTGARACAGSGAPAATLIFIMSATEFLSLYYQGSRRPAGDHGTKAFNRFLCRFFPRFNHDSRDDRGHCKRIRIPLLREGGKAFKRLNLASALIHLFHRGVVEDLVAPSGPASPCVIVPAGRWGFQIQVASFHKDFQEALILYGESARSDPQVARCFLRRYRHLHGWTIS
jgi:hypothetical protein